MGKFEGIHLCRLENKLVLRELQLHSCTAATPTAYIFRVRMENQIAKTIKHEMNMVIIQGFREFWNPNYLQFSIRTCLQRERDVGLWPNQCLFRSQCRRHQQNSKPSLFVTIIWT